MATKQAVYCVLYDWDAASRYRFDGPDERGKKIANAIVNISNIGKYGSQTPYKGGIEVMPIGELQEDENYYSKEYQIKCGANIEKYVITNAEGLPTGTIITNMNNNETKEFYGDEHFKVKIPKSEIRQDINAFLNIQAKAKIYPIFYRTYKN